MKSTVTKRGQTVVPAGLRRKYGIDKGTALEWIDTGTGIRVIPLPEDLVGSLRGSIKTGNIIKKLLKTRKEDKQRERS